VAKVDVLLPVHGRPAMLKEAIASIQAQTFKDWRLVVFDDGSTPPASVPKDGRIHLIRGAENLGAGAARNRLLQAVSAPLACWQDSDDIAHPERLARQAAFMKAYPGVDVVFTYIRAFSGKSPMASRTIWKVDTARYTTPAGLPGNTTFATAMFRRHIAEVPFHTDKARAEDFPWLRSLIARRTKFGHIAEPLYCCRKHPGRMSVQMQS